MLPNVAYSQATTPDPEVARIATSLNEKWQVDQNRAGALYRGNRVCRFAKGLC